MHKIKHILKKPIYPISIALVIAIVTGITFSIHQHNERTELFSQSSADTTTQNTVASGEDLTLAFPVGGRINSVSVKIGDTVKAGQVLASLDSQNALGAVNQAKGAYAAAQTNYDKLINGATDVDIQVAKVALSNAKNSYDNTVAQQKILVANALSALHNSNLIAMPTVANSNPAPIISGTYNSSDEGAYTIVFHPTSNGYYFSYSGIENGTGQITTLTVPLGTHGLFIQLPTNFTTDANDTWTISIPNIQSPSYLTYYNAYQTALQNQTQAISTAQGVVDAAQANLNQKVAGTRSEDLKIAEAQVESTKGALQIAEGTYNNTIITAPQDGTITNVSITAGQIATPNTPAIELLAK